MGLRINFNASPKDCEGFKDKVGKLADLETFETRRARRVRQNSGI